MAIWQSQILPITKGLDALEFLFLKIEGGGFKMEEGNDNQLKVKLAYLAVCILRGSTYLAIRIGVSDFPPALFAGLRFLIAGLLITLFAKVKGYKFPNSFREYKGMAIVGFLLLLGGNGLVVLPQLVPPSRTSFPSRFKPSHKNFSAVTFLYIKTPPLVKKDDMLYK